MIKQGLKNYFVSLKYIFTPLGTMFLGMIIGFSVLWSGAVSAVTELVDGIKSITNDVNLDFGVMSSEIWASIKTLDWSAPDQALKALFDADRINDILEVSLKNLLGTDLDAFQDRIFELASAFAAQMIAGIVVFFVFWALGFLAGFALIKVLIRRNVARRSLWKFVLAYALNALFSTALVVACIFAFAVWQNSIYISVVIALLLVGISELAQAYLLYGFKKIGLREVVNLKNIGLYVLTNFLIFVISIALTLIVVAINALAGIFVGLSFITIAIIVIGLNAEAYVRDIAEKAGATSSANTD
ncbi:MAG: hypothetical protein NC184_05135 [Roseburia sp.]|nr:hypothetical protein [Roseburia sp.]